MDELLNTAPCGFLSFSADGALEMVNRTLQEWLGYAPGELQGKHVDLILPAGSRIFYQTHFFPLLSIQGRAEEVYFPLHARDGSDIPMLVNAARRERDGAIFYDCVCMPMRKRDQYEGELLRAKAAAEEARRAKDAAYSELEAFAHSVSHDLRTPLMNIQLFTKFIVRDNAGALDARGRQYLEYVIESTTEMAQMIEDILSYSRTALATLELEPVSLDTVVSHVLDQLRPDFARREVRVERDEALPSVRAHLVLLNQIVTNLLTNAVKFVQPDVRPEVRIRAERRQAPQRVVRLWIEDNGIGIAPEDQERIFRLFDRGRAKAEFAGTGIGLAIVRKGVERMGGQVGLESTPGAGSRFWIELTEAVTARQAG